MNAIQKQFSAYNAPDSDPAPIDTPKEIANAIKKAIHDFQQKNDERLDKLEAGNKDSITEAELQKIENNIGLLKDQAEAHAKEVTRLTLGRSSAGDPDKERMTAAKFQSMTTGVRVRPSDASLDVGAYHNYCNAFEELVRNDGNLDSLGAEFRNALSTGSDRDGGILVPVEMSSEIEQRLYETSPMRQIARVIPIGTKEWEAPFKATKGQSGGWTGEKQERSKTGTAQLGIQTIRAHEQYAYPEVTQEMLDDATLNVEAFIVEDAEYEMSLYENEGFVSGNGVMKPKGFMSYAANAKEQADKDRKWGVLEMVKSGAAAGFPKFSGTAADDAGAFVDLMAALHSSYRNGAVFTMNRKTEAAVRKLRDADGRHLVGFGDMRDSTTGFNIHGHQIVNFDDMPDVGAGTFPIGFGDYRRGYYIVDRMGYRLIRDPLTNKPFVGFYITKRTGGDVRNFDAIKLMKMSA